MSGTLKRNIAAAAAREHDLVVIGGGIYGACLALEAARRGLRPVLVERGDFGGATSGASLRIAHGGLRYLQSLDVRRCRQSAAERAWMLREFPDLVRPLACLMPMYGPGPRRPGAFRMALAMDRLLTRRSCAGLPRGETVAPDRVVALFPRVPRSGLLGGGIWHDGVISSPERLIIEILRWAAGLGAAPLNYVEATGLLTSSGGESPVAGPVAGITARDAVTGETVELRAPTVINCAGPWCREVSARLGHDVERLFRPSLAFNVLLDAPPPSTHALAVAPRRPGAKLLFIVPCHGRTMAGTVHLPCPIGTTDPAPAPSDIAALLADLNEAVPGWGVSPRHVVSVLAGILPTDSEGSPHQAERPRIVRHADSGGPRGLWSVSGVKFTTARLVAQHTLERAFPGRRPRPGTKRPAQDPWPDLLDPSGFESDALAGAGARLAQLMADEAVVHLDDLVLRRTAWGLDPAQATRAAARVMDLLSWDEPRRAEELARLAPALAATGAAPRSAATPAIEPATVAAGEWASGGDGNGGDTP